MRKTPLLIHALVAPENLATLRLTDWDLLIRQARHANLVGHLAVLLETYQLLPQVPAQPKAHLESALMVVQRQTQAVQWEIECILRALSGLPRPVILLKGAAYIIMQLPFARGRLFSDVDILLPKSALEAAELLLKMHGWITAQHSAYDQRYYRTWMHELPPMTHHTRETELDVHHAILPETARLHPDPQKLLSDAIAIPGFTGLSVLSPVDMVLHSATHLFHEGEFDKGLRDLCDLDGLLRHFSPQDVIFWDRLLQRAQDMDLRRPLFYALRYTAQILHTPVPPATLQAASLYAPDKFTQRVMDILFFRAFRPRHASCDDWLTKPALWLLFIRSHWLKMPFFLLVRHLLHKTFIKPKDDQA